MEVFDTRTVVDFQKFTFSGHLRSHVYKVLNENIKLGHADYASYWTLELLCSGLVHSMWHEFFLSAASHINRAAPNVFLYLVRMYEKFAPYESQYSVMSMTDIRNNKDVRTLVCEVASTLALCRKHKLPSLPKIKPEHDFHQMTIQENLKSPSANFGRVLTKKDDPLDVYIAFNEFVYCLRPESRDFSKALYWVAWMLKYSKEYKSQHKKPLDCAFRPNPYVDDKHLRHILWMIWDAIMDAARHSPQSGTLAPYLEAIYKVHCLRWSPTDMKNRLPLLITSILFICESTTLDIHYAVPQNITVVQDMTANIPQWISAIIHTKKTFGS